MACPFERLQIFKPQTSPFLLVVAHIIHVFCNLFAPPYVIMRLIISLKTTYVYHVLLPSICYIPLAHFYGFRLLLGRSDTLIGPL